jgi:release factor glutamine methyltransferase
MFHSSRIKFLINTASTHIDRLDAEVLLAHVLGQPREFLIAHDTDHVGFFQQLQYKHLVRKRAQNFPASQLMGTKGFFGLDFDVNKHTLIPRPDTEIIVEEVLKLLPLVGGGREGVTQKENLCIIDIGTGSGCIPISILNEIRKSGSCLPAGTVSEYPDCYATDISNHALKVAKRNAKKHGVHVTFKQGNLLEPFQSEISNLKSQIIITANLPYLTEEQFTTEPSIQHEPKSALVAEKQGLALYEELLQQIKSITHYSVPITLYCEIDPTQSERMRALIHTYLPEATIEIVKDLCGLDRIFAIKL